MNKQCKESGITWSYEKNGYGFTFIFNRVTENNKSVTLDVTLSDLTPIEIEVLKMIRLNSKITREEIAVQVANNVRSIQRITNSLVAKGYILRIGNNRFGYWELLK